MVTVVLALVAGCGKPAATTATVTMGDMVLVPAGPFAMGNRNPLKPTLIERLKAFVQMKPQPQVLDNDRNEVPVHTVSWYDCVKWCNARSEKEGLTPCYYEDKAKTGVYREGRVDLDNDCVNWTTNGYRLPTEAEWEKAARGGIAGRRFPWGNTISHSQANYESDARFRYDKSMTRGYHPITGSPPCTSPVGSFNPNGYGLYDMAGNVWEWTWDRYDCSYYSSSPGSDPREPASGMSRVLRGGDWGDYAYNSRCAYRVSNFPDYGWGGGGFRCVRGL